jgi:hypothetical protein
LKRTIIVGGFTAEELTIAPGIPPITELPMMLPINNGQQIIYAAITDYQKRNGEMWFRISKLSPNWPTQEPPKEPEVKTEETKNEGTASDLGGNVNRSESESTGT